MTDRASMTVEAILVATPSMIKRTKEEKIRLRKLKEMGDKIDEGK